MSGILVGRRTLLLQQATEHPEPIASASMRERTPAGSTWTGLGRRRRPSNVSSWLEAADSLELLGRDGLLAGGYPGVAGREHDAERRLRAFADHDVTVFVDLTHPADGLEPYEGLLAPPALIPIRSWTWERRRSRTCRGSSTTSTPRWRTAHGLRPLLGRHRPDGDGGRLLADAPRPRRGRPDPPDREASSRRRGRVDALAGDLGPARDGDGWKRGRRRPSSSVRAATCVARDSAWHGEAHWRCVAATGLELGSKHDGVDRALVFCFGLLHDTRRENEAYDPGHGHRAAAFATELRAEGCWSSTSRGSRRSSRRCASTRTAGSGRPDDRSVLGRRPAPPAARLDRAGSPAALDPRRSGQSRSRLPRCCCARSARRTGRRWLRRSAARVPPRGARRRRIGVIERRHRIDTKTARDTSRVPGIVVVMDDRSCDDASRGSTRRAQRTWPGLGDPPGWIALPVGRAETGPSIASSCVQSGRPAASSGARRSSTRATSRRCGAS